MSYGRMRIEITRNYVYMAKLFLYPRMISIPDSCPELVKLLDDYTPRIDCKVLQRKVTWMRSIKCNVNEVSKFNPRPSSYNFCVRNNLGNIVYA